MSDEHRVRARRRLTINDVAHMAGVSKKTVSRVINHAPFVRQDTRSRVEAVMAETGYAPDPQARALAFRRSFLIGMVYDNPNPQFVVNMQQGVLAGLEGSGFELLVYPCQRESPAFLASLRGFVERQRLFGVLLTAPVSEDERVPELLRDLACPYIRIASVRLDEPDCMLVTPDRAGAALAGRHLAELGHRRTGYIAGPERFRSSQERLAGYREGLAACGVAFDDAYVAHGAYTFESGIEAAALLLALPQPPTAIFAANDEMAAGALRAARQAGLDVPRDLSVIGFDDYQIAARVWPPLTTIRAPTHEVGRYAARRLIESVIGVDDTPAPDIATRLIIRGSTAAPPEV